MMPAFFFSKSPSQEPYYEGMKACEGKQIVGQGQNIFLRIFLDNNSSFLHVLMLDQPMFQISQVVLVAQATLSLPEMTFKNTENAWQEHNQ